MVYGGNLPPAMSWQPLMMQNQVANSQASAEQALMQCLHTANSLLQNGAGDSFSFAPPQHFPRPPFPPPRFMNPPMQQQQQAVMQQQQPAVQTQTPGQAGSAAPNNKIDIFVVDDFSPERDQANPNNPNAFFNHGETVSSILQAGGGRPELAGNIELHKVNTDRPDMSRAQAITNSLDQIAQLAASDPSKVDVVNISQAAGLSDAETQAVQQRVQRLVDMGVPVVIAAGNSGPNVPNQLATPGALVVQSTDSSGNVLSASGPGNIRGFAPDNTGAARQTSFATPEVATLAGQLKVQGFSVSQILQQLQQIQAQAGGAIGGNPFQNVFTQNTTVPA